VNINWNALQTYVLKEMQNLKNEVNTLKNINNELKNRKIDLENKIKKV
jgi:hypothetical protein